MKRGWTGRRSDGSKAREGNELQAHPADVRRVQQPRGRERKTSRREIS